MNRSFLLMAFFMLLGMSANAQNFKFGATVGINVNKNAGLTTHDCRVGYRFGGTAMYNFSETDNSWYIGASLLLSQKGYNHVLTLDGDNNKYEGHTDLTSLQIPIVAGKNWKVGKQIGLFVETGPYIGIGLFGNSKTTYKGQTYSYSKVFDKGENNFKRMDFGWSLNVGAMVVSHIKVAIGYEHGFMNLLRAPHHAGIGNVSYYNRAATASVSYIF